MILSYICENTSQCVQSQVNSLSTEEFTRTNLQLLVQADDFIAYLKRTVSDKKCIKQPKAGWEEASGVTKGLKIYLQM